MFEINNEFKDDSKVSLANVLELLDPIASKITTNYPRHYISSAKRRYKNDERLIYKDVSKLKEKIPIDELKKSIIARLKSLDRPLQTIFFKNTSQFEKMFYPFTLFNIFIIGFLMGRFPQWFHVYYTIIFFLLMPIRFYTYYKIQSHYYMADLCYFVNLLCLLFIWVFPNNVNLFQSCFALTFGSLSFAVITWRNSLVLHSIDKTTSCFIHIIPPVTIYNIYYNIDEIYRFQRFPGAVSTIAIKDNILWTSFYYLIWQSLYHYFITLKKSKKIKSGERMTSFEYLTTHQFKNFWAVKLRSPWPVVIYTVLQYFYQLCTMVLCSIWLRYKIAAQLFLVFIFLSASYNGATYYVDYYGKNFEKEVEKLRVELKTLQTQLEAKDERSPVLPNNIDTME